MQATQGVIMKQFAASTVLLVTLLLTGCASKQPERESPAHEPFSVTEEQADQIMLVSIQQLWPDIYPGKLVDGRLGYQFELQRGANGDRVTAIAIPVEDKFKFSVWSASLTSAETDVEASNKLFRLIIQNAGIVGEFQ